MFRILKKDKQSGARLGELETAHGSVLTPCFMPCATHGAVKTLSPNELTDLGVQILLGNTYHLYLRPGDKEIKKYGGLHKFMNWDNPILTDSGGYQVFSLGSIKQESKKAKKQKLVKIKENGVEFRSHIDGSCHFFTPEKVIDIQMNLGSDIMMVLDECAPYPCSKKYAREAMERTHNWALKSLKYYKSQIPNPKDLKDLNNPKNPLLFGIIQGSVYKDLREESAKFITSLPFDGIAIGGVSVGEGKKKMYQVLDWTMPVIKNNEARSKNQESRIKNQKSRIMNNERKEKDKKFVIHNSSFIIHRPIYLMGVGAPEDILEAVEKGVDMFDCVLPTRMARHGTVWIYNQKKGLRKINLLNAKFKNDKEPLMEDCQCYACSSNFSKGYLHHLLKEGETLGMRLTTIHNLYFILNLMKKIRASIKNNTFKSFKKQFLKE